MFLIYVDYFNFCENQYTNYVFQIYMYYKIKSSIEVSLKLPSFINA